jgi:hypothetical protein
MHKKLFFFSFLVALSCKVYIIIVSIQDAKKQGGKGEDKGKRRRQGVIEN